MINCQANIRDKNVSFGDGEFFVLLTVSSEFNRLPAELAVFFKSNNDLRTSPLLPTLPRDDERIADNVGLYV